MDKKGTYKTYRMFQRKVLAGPTVRGVDTRYFADKFTRTNVTFKARNKKEADRKAAKFWRAAEFGMGSFILREIA